VARDLVDAKEDGRIKMYVTYRVLQCRRQHTSLLSEGTYTPLRAAGQHADHAFAFARSMGSSSSIVVVPRLLTRLAPHASAPLGEAVWEDTQLLVGKLSWTKIWRNVFTGEKLQTSECDGQLALGAANVFGHFPVALLIGEEQASNDAGAKNG